MTIELKLALGCALVWTFCVLNLRSRAWGRTGNAVLALLAVAAFFVGVPLLLVGIFAR